MRITGKQASMIAEIADGTTVILTRNKGQDHVNVNRVEDDLYVRVSPEGEIRTLKRGTVTVQRAEHGSVVMLRRRARMHGIEGWRTMSEPELAVAVKEADDKSGI